MRRNLITGIATLSLCFASAAPALAQGHRFAGFDGPHGANATVSLHVPLGGAREGERATLRFTAGYGRTIGAPDSNGPSAVRQLPLLDFRLDQGGLSRARLASFDLAGASHRPRLNQPVDEDEEMETKKGWLYYAIVGTLVAALIGALVAIHEENDRSEAEPTSPSSPTGG